LKKRSYLAGGPSARRESGRETNRKGSVLVKVAITASGRDLTSRVDSRFGRCSYFIVADTETGKYESVSNEVNLNAAQGAGIQTAENVSRQGVGAVISGHCGPKAYRVLKSAGIKIYLASDGTVGEVLEKFKKGMLEEAQGADVGGHWA